MSQARATHTHAVGFAGRACVTLTEWREGERVWLGVEIDGSCLREYEPDRHGALPVKDARHYFDGVVAGARAATEEGSEEA